MNWNAFRSRVGVCLSRVLGVVAPGMGKAAVGSEDQDAPRVLHSRIERHRGGPSGEPQGPTEEEVTETGLRVERTRHVDASEPDAQGLYDYYYEYDVYRFTDSTGAMSLAARSYTDTPAQASFLRVEPGAGKPARMLGTTDLRSPLFRAACAYLRARGKTDLQWLDGRGEGYSAVPETGPGR